MIARFARPPVWAMISAVLLTLWSGFAHAKPIAQAGNAQVRIVLFDEKGSCPAGTERALWVQAEGQVPGCWFSSYGRVWLFFEDGDNLAIPREVFKFTEV